MTDMVKICAYKVNAKTMINKWFHCSEIICIKSLHHKDFKTILYLKRDGWIYCRERDSFYADIICTEQPGMSYLSDDDRNHFFVFEDLKRLPTTVMPWENWTDQQINPNTM